MSQALDQAVHDYSSIKKPGFRAVVGVSFGISVLSVFGRGWIRFTTGRRLSTDDYFLFLASACLVVSAILLYNLCDQLYLATAVQIDKSLVLELNLDELTDLLQNGMKNYSSFLILAWTTTFFVKFSFLAFFRELVHRVTSIQCYYWSVVGFTVLSWMFLVAEPFILCPYFGSAALFSDIESSIPFASIAMIVLHRAKIRTRQKISLGVFLCLNLFMVCLAIVRASKINGAVGVDIPWEFFWQFMEAAVAVLTGSLTVFRTLLSSRTGASDEHRQAAAAGAHPWPHARPAYYVFSSVGRKRQRPDADLEATHNDLPGVPGATMTGLRTFIRRNNRGDAGDENDVPLTGFSQQETVVDHEQGQQLMTHGLLKSNISHNSGTGRYSQAQRS
ncbi:hypothetical protein PG984_014829 [Apiospora sp. TS-2023a]